MRRVIILCFGVLLLTHLGIAKTLQIGVFKRASLKRLKDAYAQILEAGFELKVYQKGELKKVVVDVPSSQVLAFEQRFGVKAIPVNVRILEDEGFVLKTVLRKGENQQEKKRSRVPLSKVINTLTAIKVRKDAVLLYGRMPWEYVEVEELSDPERIVIHLYNCKNGSGLGEMLVTPIPFISKLRVLYDYTNKETMVVLYPEGKVKVKIVRMGRVVRVEPSLIRVVAPSQVEVGEGQKVSLEFKDADIRDVISILSEVSGVNFVIDPEVKGTVTIKLKNVPWRKALDVILKSNGLGMLEEGPNIIRIGPVDKINRELKRRAEMAKVLEEVVPIHTKIFELDYANANELKSLVESILAKSAGAGKMKKGVEVIGRLNALLVRGTEEDLKRVEEFLKKADKPIPQVQISARIVEVATSRLKDLGINWGISFNQQETPYNFPYNIDTSGSIDLGFSPSVDPAGMLAATLLNRAQTFRLHVELRALESNGLVKIVSNPKVITMDNKEAEISQGYEIPYSTVSDQGTNVEFKDAKLELKVTPHITSHGDIILDVEVSKDSPDFAHMTPDGLPIQTRSVKTRVRLQDGETLAIGGIYEMTKQNEFRGVPGLDRVPLLKWLFGKEYKNVDKRELLIFITPTIVRYKEKVEATKQ